ncbi:protocadherin gamma-C5-like isoform X13 [Acipenser ruthenus]|uniref:protocadherin gamma-C5-like isoform X13 n=1 Tax=Acipenser ruthenus TaxID=7906 RepID=UPI002741C2D7|nr:protocadherin gamma-C5-like isoform X13 [Acipenser ruthenus]
MKENNVPGTLLCSVSASDPDLDTNSQLSYSILDTQVQDVSVSSYIYINSENGSIYTGHSFDYEQIKVFQIQVQVKDHGTPLLSSNVTVSVFILDQNDNAPAVIYPLAEMGSLPHQKMPMSAKAGYLVTKVTAVDADSGQNAWISYRFIQATDDTLFSVALHTGEIRTKRGVLEQDDASQRLVIEIKDNGEPVQSATVTVTISLENGVYEPILDYHDTSKTHGYNYITRYLIISLASISAISFLTVVILTVKCIRNSSGRYFRRAASNDGYKHANRNLQIQLNTDGPIKYVEVLGGDVQSQSQSYRSCFSPVSEPSDFTFLKPSSESSFKDAVSCVDNTGNNAFQQQKPANTDWRFSQGQRPGPSGSQRPEEAGPWPNPPTEAEQLQALMAAANEVSAATATLDAGTMGLSTRYSPQFTLQHVPDYRQNVYIPGSTSTLTGSNSQAEGKNPQPSSGNKKKSGKKEKK